jgi:hypothetical protein
MSLKRSEIPRNNLLNWKDTALTIGFLAGIGGIGFGLFNVPSMSAEMDRQVEKAHPYPENAPTQVEAKRQIAEFNEQNELLIRSGQLTLSVPPEIAARLNLAYQVDDISQERNKMTNDLMTRNWRINTDHDFNVGGGIVSLTGIFGGIATIMGSVSGLARRRFQ